MTDHSRLRKLVPAGVFLCALAVALLDFLCIDKAGWKTVARREAPSGGECVPDSEEPMRMTSHGTPAEAAVPMRHDLKESERREGIDASSFYKNAFALYAALTDEEKRILNHPGEEVDGEVAAALFAKIQSIMDLLRQAAEADFCEWGLGPITPTTVLPQVPKSMELGKLALWEAAYRFPSDPAGAMDDLRVRSVLGHHISDNIIGLLVQIQFERSANDFLRNQTFGVDSAVAEQAMTFLSQSAVDGDVSRAFEAETASLEYVTNQLLPGGDEARQFVEQLFQLASNAESDVAPLQSLLHLIDNPQGLRAELAYTQAIESQMAEAILLPAQEFETWWRTMDTELKTTREEHPLAAMIIPGIEGVQYSVQRTRIERQMLAAGFAIQQSGLGQVGLFRDPVTGASFHYVPQNDGFELQSMWKVKGRPVTMHFGGEP